MLTTTHILVGAAIASRPYFRSWQITLAWLGGFTPDASVFLMVAVSRVADGSNTNIWRKPDGLYWQEPWQTFSAISNSVPMWILLALSGLVIFRVSEKFRLLGLSILIFGVAALSHVLSDFLVHTDDAHVHFWPFSDWRFHSAVSYYQSSHYGDIFRVFEMVLNAGLTIYLFVRFKQWPVRVFAVLFAAPPILMQILAPLMF